MTLSQIRALTYQAQKLQLESLLREAQARLEWITLLQQMEGSPTRETFEALRTMADRCVQVAGERLSRDAELHQLEIARSLSSELDRVFALLPREEDRQVSLFDPGETR